MNNESREHKALKFLAELFLRQMGCNDVTEEYPLIGRPPAKGSRRVDVVGFKDDRVIAIECGGNRDEHLSHVASKVDELYLLPYGEIKPQRYEENRNVCFYCGHKI